MTWMLPNFGNGRALLELGSWLGSGLSWVIEPVSGGNHTASRSASLRMLSFVVSHRTQPIALSAVVDHLMPSVAVVIISDAGAARGQYDVVRLLDTLAFLKAIRRRTQAIVWLNPVRPADWRHSTAGAIARHVPMLPMTRQGHYDAVGVLRGRPVFLEAPL